jgi:hypothetical protein
MHQRLAGLGGCQCPVGAVSNILSSAGSSEVLDDKRTAAAPCLLLHLAGDYVSYINLADLPPDGADVNEA